MSFICFLNSFCRGSSGNHLPGEHWQGWTITLKYSSEEYLITRKFEMDQCILREIYDQQLYFQILYWGTAKWSPVEIFETFSMAR